MLNYLQEESHKRQATLCQSKANRGNEACAGIKLEDGRSLAKARATESTVVAKAAFRAPASTSTFSFNGVVANSVSSTASLSVAPVVEAIQLDSIRALQDRCAYLRTEAEGAQTDIVPKLEQQCFAQNQMQQSPVQQAIAQIASPEAILKANQAEGDAKQLLNNGLYAESLVKYEEAISLNCNNAFAWANMGILLSTANKESEVQDYVQAQCALLRATTLNENAGWMRHSLCVAQAKDARGDLGRFLSYESCRLARQLEPINDALYDKLFYMEIGDRYRELKEYEPARDAYVQALSNEQARNCKTKEALTSLLALQDNGIEDVKELACKIYQSTVPTPLEEDQLAPACEVELNALMAQQDCV